MEKKAIIPLTHSKPLYYRIHIQYVINYLKAAGYAIQLQGFSSIDDVNFHLLLNNHCVQIDFSNFQSNQISNTAELCLKFQYSENGYSYKNILPFPKVCFYNWEEYKLLCKNILYKCNNNVIINMQRPYGGALERRKAVQKILQAKHNVIIEQKPQTDFWKQINNCLVAVFVPGARNDILDRGHLQYLALGCCTISPRITDLLPQFKRLESYEHYIVCKDDYSDLHDKIQWCKDNRNECIKIGNNAKNLFLNYCMPINVCNWIEKQL